MPLGIVPVELVTFETVVELAHDLQRLVGGLDQAVQLGVELGVAVPPPRDGANLLHVVIDGQHRALRFLCK